MQRLILILAFGVASLISFDFAVRAEATQDLTIVVVVARDAPVQNITLSQLRRTYGGDVSEVEGQRIVPFNMSTDNVLRNTFDLLVLRMDQVTMQRYWIDRRIRGEGLPPKSLPSAQVAKAIVTKVPGAIAYIAAQDLDHSVKALTVDSKSYTDPAYALRGR